MNHQRFNKSIRNIWWTVRKWSQKDHICTGIHLKAAFLHVPIRDRALKLLRFKQRKILLAGCTFWSKILCILTLMARLILNFLHSTDITGAHKATSPPKGVMLKCTVGHFPDIRWKIHVIQMCQTYFLLQIYNIKIPYLFILGQYLHWVVKNWLLKNSHQKILARISNYS